MKLLAGVEEAGRGPVIGPLVMAIVAVGPGVQEKLTELGVKDSKQVLPAKRKVLFNQIIEIVDKYEIKILSPNDVDDALNDPSMNLNKLEAKTSGELIDKIFPDKVIIDCPTVNLSAYTETVRGFMKHKSVEIISENKADENYPVVAAASILAKVTRDRLVEELAEKAKVILGPVEMGSGYPADPKTKAFLEKYWDKLDSIEGGFFRKTWKTYSKIAKAKSQTGLAGF